MENKYLELYKAIDTKINASNHLVYEHRTCYGYGEIVYRCVLCKDKTSLYHSISFLGDRLICLKCVKKHFSDDKEAMLFTQGYFLKEVRKCQK